MMLPNRLIRSYLNALDEILGKNGVNTILNHSGLSEWIVDYPPENETKAVSYESFSKIQTALEDIYGHRMGQNLSRRAARTSFKTVGSDLVGVDQPEPSKNVEFDGIKDMMNTFITLFADDSGAVKWSSTKDEMIVTFSVCPNCLDREANEPICHACSGWIEGLVELLGIGDNMEVTETACLASGDDHCSFSIQPG